MPAEGGCRKTRNDVQNRLLDKAGQAARKKGCAPESRPVCVEHAGECGKVHPRRRPEAFRAAHFPGLFCVLSPYREGTNGRLLSSGPCPLLATLFEGRRPGYERFSLQRKGEPAESRRQVPSVSCRPSVGIRVLRTEREPLPDPDLSPVLWVVLLDVSDKEGSCLRGPAKTASGMRLGDACHPPQSDILTQLGRGFSKFLSPVGGMEGERGHCKTPLFELSCRAHPYDRGRRIRECLP